MKTRYLFCRNCTYPMESKTPLNQRIGNIDIVDAGRYIYYSVLDDRFRSIDLCNVCYAVMQAYRHSLSEEERNSLEKRKI